MSWYENTGTPGNDSEANSDVLRAEFAAISESFDLFPDLAGNPDKFLVVNGTGSSVVLLSKAELLELLNLDSEKTPTFSGLSLEGTNPEINLYDTNGTADARKWRIGYGAAQILFQALNDAGNVIANFFQVTKIGNAISSIVYGNSTDNPDHVFRGNIGGNKDPSFPLDLVPTDGTVTTLSRMSTVGLGINAIQRLSCDSGFSCYQFFGDEEDSNVFQVRANHVNGRYSITVNTVEMLLMDSVEGTSFTGGDSFQFDPDGNLNVSDWISLPAPVELTFLALEDVGQKSALCG